MMPYCDIAQLRRTIARLQSGHHGGRQPLSPLKTGAAAVDSHLAEAGLYAAGVHEIAGTGLDEEHAAIAAAFLTLCLRDFASAPTSPVLWAVSQADLYPPGLAGLGLDASRLIMLRVDRDSQIGWALEEALRCPALGAVVGEMGKADMTTTRRLQLAAERAQTPCFILRRWPSAELARDWRTRPIAAATRWRIRPLPVEERDGSGRSLQAARWLVDLWRCRNGRPASWIMEVAYAANHAPTLSALPVDLADPLGHGLPREKTPPGKAGRRAFS